MLKLYKVWILKDKFIIHLIVIHLKKYLNQNLSLAFNEKEKSMVYQFLSPF